MRMTIRITAGKTMLQGSIEPWLLTSDLIRVRRGCSWNWSTLDPCSIRIELVNRAIIADHYHEIRNHCRRHGFRAIVAAPGESLSESVLQICRDRSLLRIT